MSEGWICLYREIQSHWIWQNRAQFQAWIAILLGVNHASRKVAIGSRVLVAERGESLRSCDQWAQVFGPDWDRFKVRRFFQLLERDGMIRTKNERKTLRLTVCNYDSYQIQRTNSAPTLHRPRTNCAPTVHTNNNDKPLGNNEEQERDTREDLFSGDDPPPSRPVDLEAPPIPYRLQEVYQEICRTHGAKIARNALKAAQGFWPLPSDKQLMATLNAAADCGALDLPPDQWPDFRKSIKREQNAKQTGSSGLPSRDSYGQGIVA